jgi:hypothetical protein
MDQYTQCGIDVYTEVLLVDHHLRNHQDKQHKLARMLMMQQAIEVIPKNVYPMA